MQRELETVLRVLPVAISDCIRQSVQYKSGNGINEIHIRSNRHLALTYKGKNVLLGYKVRADELSECVMSLCKRSLYSYMDTILEGYIPFGDSIRVGVCGSAVCQGDKIVNITGITSLNIRIPCTVFGVARELYKALSKGNFCESAVIYSPPGAGKTTMLRDIALSLARGENAKRVSVIDSRRELCDANMAVAENIDVYASYPKAKGIELATRTMAPEYLICDEIGHQEAEAILACQSMGVPMIIGAHARDIESLIRSGPFAKLHSAGLFDIYAKINVSKEGNRTLEIVRRGEKKENDI